MEKERTNGYYFGKYLKDNALVLLCELIVVLLLSVICCIILGGEPLWLAPTLTAVMSTPSRDILILFVFINKPSWITD